MALDALDQKTLSSLPRLSEVLRCIRRRSQRVVPETKSLHCTNAPVFSIPKKLPGLFPHLKQVRDNWRRMLKAGDSLLDVLTAGDKKTGLASIAVGARRITAGRRNTCFREQPDGVPGGDAGRNGSQHFERY